MDDLKDGWPCCCVCYWSSYCMNDEDDYKGHHWLQRDFSADEAGRRWEPVDVQIADEKRLDETRTMDGNG